MPALWNLEWNNHNSQRSYPLTEWATKKDRTGTITIPDDFILGLYLPVSAGLDVQPDKFFIKTVGIYTTGYVVEVGYDDGTENGISAAVLHFGRDTHVENRTYALPGVDDFAEAVGHIVIGRLDSIDLLPAGSYSFSAAGGALESDGIRPHIRGISSIVVVNGSDRSEKIYGDIELVAYQNMRLVVAGTTGDWQIQFSAISGEGLNQNCACPDTENLGTPIRFINGIPPAANGNFRISGDPCIDVSPLTNGLQLTDECSQPCCGDSELAALRAELRRFADGALTLQNFANSLKAEVGQLVTNVLGSKLSDEGCSS